MSKDSDLNRDPLSGAPGAHPVGAGLGATSGALAGVAVGAIGGPPGAAIGAAVGGLIGGLAGKGLAETFNPTIEDSYWSKNYDKEAYYDPAFTYDDYSPAYRYGYGGRERYHNRNWAEAEGELAAGWDQARGKSRLAWEKAKHAARAAWDRVEDAVPGDSDRDGH